MGVLSFSDLSKANRWDKIVDVLSIAILYSICLVIWCLAKGSQLFYLFIKKNFMMRTGIQKLQMLTCI